MNYILDNYILVNSSDNVSEIKKHFPSYYSFNLKEWKNFKKMITFDKEYGKKYGLKTTENIPIKIRYSVLKANDLTGELEIGFYLIADRYNNNQDLYQPTQGPYNESNSSKWVEFKITGLNKINVEDSKNNLLEKFNLSIKENVNHSLIANLIKEKSNNQSWFEDKTSEDSLFNALSFQFFRDPYYDYLKISDFYNLKFNNVSIEDTYDNDKKLLKLNGTEIFSPFSIEIKPVSISNYFL